VWELAVTSAAGAALAGVGLLRWHHRHPELRWDWSTIDVDALLAEPFPEGFQWGSATAAHQVEGGNTGSNWSWWEDQVDAKGEPRVARGQRAGAAAEHWTRYPEDLRRMRDEIGLDHYRFSVEWSRIQPERGVWNQEAIDHYSRMVDEMLRLGITPMATLHHFTHPLWFERLRSFEEERNIALFEVFAERVFRVLSDRVPLWCTHNECGPFAAMGWGLGQFPPGVQDARRMCAVLHNLMRSHVRVYQRLKAIRPGAKIGLVKNIFQFDPWSRWNPLHWAICRLADHVYNESIIGLLRDGVFRVRIPGMLRIEDEIPGARQAADFVGLNYYSNLLIRLRRLADPHSPLVRSDQVTTDFPYATYPEGFYRALHRMATLGKPIIVTENGIPDKHDDRRADWIRRYLAALKRAMNEGVDVRGYYYWTLIDNFEWAEGYDMRFGLFGVDFETQERTLRGGAAPLVEIVRRHQGAE